MNHEGAFAERLDSLRGDAGAIEIEHEGRRKKISNLMEKGSKRTGRN